MDPLEVALKELSKINSDGFAAGNRALAVLALRQLADKLDNPAASIADVPKVVHVGGTRYGDGMVFHLYRKD